MFNPKAAKRLRKLKSITLKHMAKEIGYKSVNGYFCIEAGLTNPTADKVEAIAKVLKIPMEDLFSVNPQESGELK